MAAIVLVVAGLTVGLRVSQAPAAPAHPGPLRPGAGPMTAVDQNDVGDPFILTVSSGGATTYYRFGTTDHSSNVPAATSSDLVHWSYLPDALPDPPAWAARTLWMTWAPATLRVAGGYVLYFTTQEALSGLQCIGRAWSSRPEGPYRDDSAGPLVCQRAEGGSIDASVVTTASGAHSLLWKNDGNSSGLPDALWSQSLAGDGLAVSGPLHRLLGAGVAWEQGVVEGPAMVAASQGGYWLFFSGGNWRSEAYQTGLAWCPTVSGPCQETSDHPWLATSPDLLAPGGLEVFSDAQGHPWVALSSFVVVESTRHPGHFFHNRVLDVARLVVR